MNRIEGELLAWACLALAVAGCAQGNPRQAPAAATPVAIAASEPAQLLTLHRLPPVGRTAPHASANHPDLPRAGKQTLPRETSSGIALVSYDQPSELPAPPGEAPVEELPAPTPVPAPLTLDEVIQSVRQSYPLLSAAQREYDIAAGQALAAWGDFDLRVEANSIAQPLGFYENYRSGAMLSQPLWRGGSAYGAYRLGDGSFPDWYGERETDEGGEFKLGLAALLLQGRAIDERRAAVRQTALAREAAAPAIQMQALDYARAASQTYWTWLASGLVLELQRELLQLAVERAEQIEERVRVGDLARVALLTNRQIIASREAMVIAAERKLQEAAIKLSLFLRTPAGQPVLPARTRLPEDFPDYLLPDPNQLQDDIAAALAARPELREMDLQQAQTRVELALAENALLPKIEARLEGSKDVGAPASAKRDKTPLELEAGLFGEMPLQRRAAQGKIRAAEGKLVQIAAKRAFATDKIVSEVQDAYSALAAAGERTERARQNLNLARQSLELARIAFEAGDIDVLMLNLYEQAVADAQLSLISAQADYFLALADYRAALALPL
jgi:outer membrane protein TolC